LACYPGSRYTIFYRIKNVVRTRQPTAFNRNLGETGFFCTWKWIMPLNLAGAHILLRALESRDLPHLLEAYKNLDLQLQTDGDAPPMSDVQVKTFWEDIISNPGDDLRYFAIEPVAGSPGAGQMIGACSLQHIDLRNRHAELAVFLVSDQWHGKGFGTEAVRLLLDYAFEAVRLDKVHLGVYDFNEGGIRSYERVGFHYEGRLRQMIYYDGRYWDEWVMGILRADWDFYRQPPADGLHRFHPAELDEALVLIQKLHPAPDKEAARAILRRWWRQIDRVVYSYQVHGELVGLVTLGLDASPPPILDWLVNSDHRPAIEGMAARLA
jgi:RimJ/RimL family protein N-acetyltransferase